MDNQIKIMIVDDEDTIRDSLADVLKLQGFEVSAARNGAEAIKLLEAGLPDLILADIMMPEMNGYQLYQRVRSNPDWTWLPFIFLTAKGDPEDVRFAKELGADDYLKKPIDVEDLSSAIYGRLKRFKDLQGSKSEPLGSGESDSSALEGVARRFDLTRRETDVVACMVAGMSNAEIATELVVGVTTVKSHVSSILSKLQARSRAEVVSIVLKTGKQGA